MHHKVRIFILALMGVALGAMSQTPAPNAPAQPPKQPTSPVVAPPTPIPLGTPRPNRDQLRAPNNVQRPTVPPVQPILRPGFPPNPGAPGGGAAAANNAAAAETEGFLIAFAASPIGEVLEEYYRVTGRRVLRDKGMENVTVSIEVPGEFTKEEYLDIIEKGLLLHGYALVPSGVNLFKLVAAEGGGSPSAQNVPVILRPDDLPTTDQVVTHVLRLKYLKAADAATAFQQIIPPHSYGKVVAVPNASSIIITEASQTIRAYVTLAEHVDVAPGETKLRTIHLERADAEEVAGQLGELLGLGSEGGKSGGAASTSYGARPTAAPAPATPPGSPAARAAAGAANVSPGAVSAVVGGEGESQTKIQAITRTNSLLIIASPLEIEYIESLVKELDAESPSRGFVSRRLNYIDLSTFMDIASKALQRYSKDAASGSTKSGGDTKTTTTTTQVGSTNSGFGSSFGGGGGGYGGSGGYGGGGYGGGGGGLGSGGGGGLGAAAQLDVTTKAESMVIGKTFVMVDPASSKFFASGPPEELRMLNEMADELDVRPRQVFLSAIVGEFNLGDEFNFGLDWVNTLQEVGKDNLVGGVFNTQGGFVDLTKTGKLVDIIAEGGPAAASGLTAYGQIGEHLNVFLRTLEKTNRFQVLQKPTVTTLNHQPATIYIGQRIPIAGQTYTTGTGGVNNNLGFTSTTDFVSVRLQLQITPHIFNDKEVMLEFRQENNDVSGFTTISGNRVPNISEQGMQNSLIVPDRTAVMLGGLITERDTNDKTGLPFLVRVPILKHLFGSTNKQKSRRELMIFVQPHIMAGGEMHVMQQAEWAKGNGSYDSTLRFAQPQDDTPLDALPPSDKRSQPGEATPLLPLPNWHPAEGEGEKQPVRKTIQPPKAEAVYDEAPQPSNASKARAFLRRK